MDIALYGLGNKYIVIKACDSALVFVPLEIYISIVVIGNLQGNSSTANERSSPYGTIPTELICRLWHGGRTVGKGRAFVTSETGSGAVPLTSALAFRVSGNTAEWIAR